MLPRSQRLSSAQFGRAFQNAQTVRHPLVALRVFRRSDDNGETRAAFVVPKKQGKATRRNRVRRRLRERYRLHPRRFSALLAGCDLIFLATPQTGEASLAQLDEALEHILTRAHKKIAGHFSPESSPNPDDVLEKRAQADAGMEKPSPGVLAGAALFLIRFYQRFVSPLTPPSCRFYPTCSCYTYAAIERFGFGRGVIAGFFRLCRCHPWHPGGEDPVPNQWSFPIKIKKKSLFAAPAASPAKREF